MTFVSVHLLLHKVLLCLAFQLDFGHLLTMWEAAGWLNALWQQEELHNWILYTTSRGQLEFKDITGHVLPGFEWGLQGLIQLTRIQRSYTSTVFFTYGHHLIFYFRMYASLAKISTSDSGKMQIGVMHLSRQEHLREIWDGCCYYMFSWLDQMAESQERSISCFSDGLLYGLWSSL